MIASTAQEYEVIKPIITQLDTMPLQVLVDATIVSVNLTDNLRYGIQWYLNHDSQGAATSGSSPSGVDLRAVAAAAVTGHLYPIRATYALFCRLKPKQITST